MSHPASPRAVFDRLIQGISDGRWDDLADLYAEDAVVDQPFVSTAPSRLEGRATIRAHFAGAARMGLRMTAHHIVVHETADPEVVIAEFTYDIIGTGSAPDGPLTAANIQVLRVRDGLIAASRDYHDHLALARATGQLPALVTALSGGRA
jgi:uncharacterized protein